MSIIATWTGAHTWTEMARTQRGPEGPYRWLDDAGVVLGVTWCVQEQKNTSQLNAVDEGNFQCRLETRPDNYDCIAVWTRLNNLTPAHARDVITWPITVVSYYFVCTILNPTLHVYQSMRIYSLEERYCHFHPDPIERTQRWAFWMKSAAPTTTTTTTTTTRTRAASWSVWVKGYEISSRSKNLLQATSIETRAFHGGLSACQLTVG